MQPRFKLVAARDRQVLQAQPVDLGVIDAIAAGRALDRRRGQLQIASFSALDGPLEGLRPPIVIDRGPKTLELIARRLIQPAGDEQAIEREVEVDAAGGSVADGDSEVLLQRRARVKPDVVIRPKEMGFAEPLELGGELAGGSEQMLVVAPTVGLEPVPQEAVSEP